MRRLSLSRFSLFGCVVSVVSAFSSTIKNTPPAAVSYEVRCLPSYTYTSAPTPVQAQGGGLLGTYLVPQNLLGSSFTSHCLSDDIYFCLTQIKIDNGTPSIISTSFGECSP